MSINCFQQAGADFFGGWLKALGPQISGGNVNALKHLQVEGIDNLQAQPILWRKDIRHGIERFPRPSAVKVGESPVPGNQPPDVLSQLPGECRGIQIIACKLMPDNEVICKIEKPSPKILLKISDDMSKVRKKRQITGCPVDIEFGRKVTATITTKPAQVHEN